MILQTVFGHYQKPQEAFNWLLPAVLPTLTLIVGVFIADVVGTGGDSETEPDSFTYKLSLGMSIAYLLVVSFTILIEPFSDYDPEGLMKISNLWLSPLQGLVAATVGIFFVKKR
jgi:cytochrome c-type biogenesis protein CcmH/NrfF